MWMVLPPTGWLTGLELQLLSSGFGDSFSLLVSGAEKMFPDYVSTGNCSTLSLAILGCATLSTVINNSTPRTIEPWVEEPCNLSLWMPLLIRSRGPFSKVGVGRALFSHSLAHPRHLVSGYYKTLWTIGSRRGPTK